MLCELASLESKELGRRELDEDHLVYTPVPGESASRVARLAGQATTSRA
jgi:hypothetical protein